MIEPFYQDDCGITLYCGDCADIAPQLGVFDLLLTDPPYGIGVSKKTTVGNEYGAARRGAFAMEATQEEQSSIQPNSK